MSQITDPLSAYIDLTELADFIGAGSITATTEPGLLRIVRASSRIVDRHCKRWFYQEDGAYRYLGIEAPSQNQWLFGDDLAGAATAFEYDDDDDGSYGEELVIGVSDVRALYEPGQPPYSAVTIRPTPSVAVGPHRLRVTGDWGYPRNTDPSGDTVQDDPLAAGATTITVSDEANFAIGQTLLLESEQVHVTGTGTGELTVVRGINGTTAAEHVQTTAITVCRYPDVVWQATGIIAARLTRRQDVAFAPTIPESLVADPSALIDSYVTRILEPYRKVGIA